jgi:hypothetical protein
MSIYRLALLGGGGQLTVNVFPLSTSFSKLTVPPKASDKRLTTANLKPCTFDLVVKVGVNKLALISSGIPVPVSPTDVIVVLSEVFVARLICEFCDMLFVVALCY